MNELLLKFVELSIELVINTPSSDLGLKTPKEFAYKLKDDIRSMGESFKNSDFDYDAEMKLMEQTIAYLKP